MHLECEDQFSKKLSYRSELSGTLRSSNKHKGVVEKIMMGKKTP